MSGGALVIGLGSIGRRHVDVLRAMGVETAIVSRRGGDGGYPDIASALKAEDPGYVVVATETVDHDRVLHELAAAGYRGKVMVEKPLFADHRAMPAHGFSDVVLGYTLRCHPGLRRLKELLAGQTIISAQLYVGQYLPDWRPGRDYREVYSGSKAAGGGVLRDLSHELDCALWLFGDWQRVAALGGRLSSLEIDSDDCWGLLAQFQHCPIATVQLNYLDRQTRRSIVVNTDDHSYHLDFIAGTLSRDAEPPETFVLASNQVYTTLHSEILTGDLELHCLEAGGLAAMALITAVEAAAEQGQWITPSDITSDNMGP